MALRLIAGLGNPGAEYADTRHNAGFRFLERLSARVNAELRLESRYQALTAKVRIAQCECWLVAPQTYMNNSGDAVARLAQFYKIAPQEILVAHDELDLPLGVVRLKQGGGVGGHNGLSDIVAKLGSADFFRLRIGIGHPGSAAQVVGYVLKKAPAAEATLTDAAIDEALHHVDDMVRGETSKVMNTLHRFNAAANSESAS